MASVYGHELLRRENQHTLQGVVIPGLHPANSEVGRCTAEQHGGSQNMSSASALAEWGLLKQCQELGEPQLALTCAFVPSVLNK